MFEAILHGLGVFVVGLAIARLMRTAGRRR